MDKQSNSQKKRSGRKSFFGLFVIFLGAWWLLRRIRPEEVPDWILTWPVLVIALGFVTLLSHGFRNAGAYILMFIGSFFLFRDYLAFPSGIDVYILPGLVMLLGLLILFKPKKKGRRGWGRRYENGKRIESNACSIDKEAEIENAEQLDTLAVFSAVKKDIISKEFKGGEITAVMGGVELNFRTADIDDKAVIDLTLVMGGLKIIVPNHWDVQVNSTNIAGGVEDKRSYHLPEGQPTKTLYINGTIVLGGIEINSY